ncbi:hypothetical protein C3747_100g67 [Trypanosoma cruzi]|uniref:Uncharacterized protein n=1 Tax=Trypanosoma cruzi TaxID=5693 RepID=A0A2V2WID0_TRYCR|nr:hypothetical protein C3747_100g67 [Trypanosoma cruzi]
MGCRHSGPRMPPLEQQQGHSLDRRKERDVVDMMPGDGVDAKSAHVAGLSGATSVDGAQGKPSHRDDVYSPMPPQVPSNSWYAREFTEVTRMSLTEFHMKKRGNVVFSNAYIPVGASELEKLPGRAPPMPATLEIGRDLVYGMAYLHNTPLFTEHQWRLRVAHHAKWRQDEGKKHEGSEERRSICRREWAKTIYDRPGIDTLVGIRVFVENKLVPDEYPTTRSIPNCTATIDASEAFNNWICIPIVLVGYLNNFLLGTITLYRFLSLNFAGYMLRQPINLSGVEAAAAGYDGDGEGADDCSDDHASRKFEIYVEVVYGCSSEFNFCTDYISKGSVEVIMTRRSKLALKTYKERLHKLIQGSLLSREQVVPMDRLEMVAQQQSSRNCLFCGSPLRYTCTICGAQLCGTLMCVWRPFAGYPSGCSVHKAQVIM